jgi:hypothetical protein
MGGGSVIPNRLAYFEFLQSLNDTGAEDEADKQRRQRRVSASERQVLKHIEGGKILD